MTTDTETVTIAHRPIYTGDAAILDDCGTGGIIKGSWYCGHCAESITGKDDTTPCNPLCMSCDTPTTSGHGLNPICHDCDTLSRTDEAAYYALLRKNGKLE